MVDDSHSRAALYRRLSEELGRLEGDVAIDVGCSRLVTANLFRTTHYYGIEMQRDRLDEGLARQGLRPNVTGIVGALPRLDRIPSNCADVVVCTDVLFWLKAKDQLKAIQELTRFCKSSGTLIVTVKQSPRYSRTGFIRGLFEHVRVDYFRGTATPMMRAIDRLPLLRPLDRLLRKRGAGNVHAFIVATGKKDKQPDAPFDLSRLERLAGGLYSAADGPLPQSVTRQELEGVMEHRCARKVGDSLIPITYGEYMRLLSQDGVRLSSEQGWKVVEVLNDHH